MRIDVDPSGNAWLVNNSGGIFWWNGSAWENRNNSYPYFTDVGVEANDSAWAIGQTGVVVGGGFIYRWNGSGWTQMPGAAQRVSVDMYGNAWLVNSGHNVYRWNGSGWQLLPGLANDVG